jgi:hypothetical protein
VYSKYRQTFKDFLNPKKQLPFDSANVNQNYLFLLQTLLIFESINKNTRIHPGISNFDVFLSEVSGPQILVTLHSAYVVKFDIIGPLNVKM